VGRRPSAESSLAPRRGRARILTGGFILTLVVIAGTIGGLAPGCRTAAPDTRAPKLTPEQTLCTSDDECQITTYGGGCCECAKEPYAITRQSIAKATDICSVVDCDSERKADPNAPTCRPVGDPGKFRAVCRSHDCVREPL